MAWWKGRTRVYVKESRKGWTKEVKTGWRKFHRGRHDKNDEALGINLDLLEEKREHVTIQEEKSKAKMEKYYNSRVRNTSFRPGDFVYRNNKASHAEEGGKLRP
nr:reverse transcriptase domain-containing protein [Tanacetum cinerariifolium]